MKRRLSSATGSDSNQIPPRKVCTPRIGAHLPIKGGLHEALLLGAELGCGAIQLFSRNPRGWMAKPLTREAIDLFRQTRKRTKILPVLIHANYLINLAAADELLAAKSIVSFREEVERAILLGVDYLVVHPASAPGPSHTPRTATSPRRPPTPPHPP